MSRQNETVTMAKLFLFKNLQKISSTKEGKKPLGTIFFTYVSLIETNLQTLF